MLGFAIIIVGFRWAPWLLTAFFILNCLVLIIVVLLQSGKAADLAGAFGGRRQPNCIWTTRGRVCAFAGDHVVRGDVHDLRNGVGGARGSWRGIRRIDLAEVFEARTDTDSDGLCPAPGARANRCPGAARPAAEESFGVPRLAGAYR